MKPLILTFTGRHVNPLDPGLEGIDIFDIAHALACCNRFAGHAREPISVAQHSVYVSRLVSASVARQALLHDASEAYLGDITKWLKGTPEFEAYRKVEHRVQRQIYQRFSCPLDEHQDIQIADRLMLRFEGMRGFGRRMWTEWVQEVPKEYASLITLDEDNQIGPWTVWPWQIAEMRFLARASELGVL